jgi:hypothetical protein
MLSTCLSLLVGIGLSLYSFENEDDIPSSPRGEVRRDCSESRRRRVPRVPRTLGHHRALLQMIVRKRSRMKITGGTDRIQGKPEPGGHGVPPLQLMQVGHRLQNMRLGLL